MKFSGHKCQALVPNGQARLWGVIIMDFHDPDRIGLEQCAGLGEGMSMNRILLALGLLAASIFLVRLWPMPNAVAAPA